MKSRGRAHLAWRSALVVVAVIAAIACKKKSAPAPSTSNSASPPSSATVEEAESAMLAAQPSDPFAPDPRALPSFESSPTEVPIGTDTVSSTFVIKGTPADPFDAAKATLRARAVGCFAPLPPGEYGATITVHVTPTGYPSRTEIDPGNVDDPSVLDCLKGAAESGSFPASPDGRTVVVDVSVKG